jgi:phosphoglycerate dehydrogenase-like enzyme
VSDPMTARPAGLPRKAGPRMLLPSHFRAALDHVTANATWYEDVEEALSGPVDQEAVWLAGVFVPGNAAAGLFVPGDTATRLLQRNRSLRWVHYSATGVEHMPLDLFRERGVVLTNGAGLYAQPIAEHVVMCMLVARLNLLGVLGAQAASAWTPDVESDQELSGSVALILGYGQLGRAIGTRLHALGVDVLAARRSAGLESDGGVVSAGDWRARLPDVDFLVLTLPSTRETRNIIGASELAALKQGAWIVNVARGNLVDESALLDALAAGRLGGAALDAFAQEPLPPDHPLWRLPNVILSPHSSWRSSRLDERQVELFSDNLGRFLTGRPFRNVVDLDAGY